MSTPENPSVIFVKERAKEELQILKQLLPEGTVKLGHLLEFAARKEGHTDWRAYKKSLNALLVESEKLPQDPLPNLVDHSILIPSGKPCEQYEESVLAMVAIAFKDWGSSRVAAQVLLSAYNGNNFQLDVVDLTKLDQKNMLHALRVMWGRAQDPCLEPHQAIENGEDIFHNLWDRWAKTLHVQNRWKCECIDCYGRGWQYLTDDDADNDIRTKCSSCGGKGRMPEIEWPGYIE